MLHVTAVTVVGSNGNDGSNNGILYFADKKDTERFSNANVLLKSCKGFKFEIFFPRAGQNKMRYFGGMKFVVR